MSKINVPFVNLGIQYLDLKNEILEKFNELSTSGSYILGSEVEEFEKEFAALCGTRFALGIGNGADALFLIMKAMGIGPGDEVITAPNSFLASAGTIVATGATPRFCDVSHDYNLDPAQLEKAITARTKAIMPVHLTGLPADMDAINDIARRHNLFVLEDCAQAVNATYKGKKVGGLSDAGAFSLHPLKNLHVHGDGGAITTNNESLYQRIRLLRNHGLKNRDECEVWGYNSRLDTIQAAICRIKLKHIGKWTLRYQEISQLYSHGLEGVVKLPQRYHDREGVYHNFVIMVERREELQNFLLSKGIETKIHYPIPIHLQKPAKELGYKLGDFPVSETQSKSILSLPIYPEITNLMVDQVISGIREFYKKV